MTERNDHTEAADDAERRADAMEGRSQRLADDIEGTREQWERKQADERVPGAVGDPEPGGEEAEKSAIAGSSDEDKSPAADAEVGDPDTPDEDSDTTDDSDDESDSDGSDDSGDSDSSAGGETSGGS